MKKDYMTPECEVVIMGENVLCTDIIVSAEVSDGDITDEWL